MTIKDSKVMYGEGGKGMEMEGFERKAVFNSMRSITSAKRPSTANEIMRQFTPVGKRRETRQSRYVRTSQILEILLFIIQQEGKIVFIFQILIATEIKALQLHLRDFLREKLGNKLQFERKRDSEPLQASELDDSAGHGLEGIGTQVKSLQFVLQADQLLQRDRFKQVSIKKQFSNVYGFREIRKIRRIQF